MQGWGGVTRVFFIYHVLPAYCHPYTQLLWFFDMAILTPFTLLTLGMHALRRLQYLSCVCVCVSACHAGQSADWRQQQQWSQLGTHVASIPKSAMVVHWLKYTMQCCSSICKLLGHGTQAPCIVTLSESQQTLYAGMALTRPQCMYVGKPS